MAVQSLATPPLQNCGRGEYKGRRQNRFDATQQNGEVMSHAHYFDFIRNDFDNGFDICRKRKNVQRGLPERERPEVDVRKRRRDVSINRAWSCL
jgi:hypothetical protein